MQWLGDIKAGRTLDFAFDTSVGGLPSSLSVATVKVYKGSSATTETAIGVTITTDFDALIGLNHVTIDTSADAAFYAAGNDFQIVLTTATLGGNTIRRVLAHFSIENRCLNWAQIVSPTTTVGLSGTTIGVVSSIASGAIAAASFAANALDAVWSTATRTLTVFGFSVTVGTNNDKTGYGLSAAAIQAIWDALSSALTTVGSIGKRIVDFLTGDAFVRLGAPAGASISADMAAIKVDTAAILDDTGSAGVVVAAASKSGYALSAAGVQAIWDALTSALITAGSIGKRIVDFLTGDIFARLGSPAGASIAADIATRATPAQVNIEADQALADAGVTAALTDKLTAHAAAVLKAVIGTGSTTTQVVLDGSTGINGGAPASVNDFYNGRILVFTSGALAGQATDITDYDGTTKMLTVTALTGAPVAAVTAVIV